MYEEEKKGSFIKDLIIKLLYFFLFLFLFMWLYPAPKVDLDDIEVNVDEKALDPLYKQVFNNNINTMKEAGKSYFTTNRLPSKTGDKVSITLKDMINKKLLLEFTDEEGNSCNNNESYIEVTKSNDSEYNMKVYLSCNNKKDYINEIIGCTNVCPTGTCTNVATNNNSTTTNKNTTTGTTGKTNYSYSTKPATNSTTTTITSNTTKNVTVYFDVKGGTNVNPQTVAIGNTVYAPATSKNGYTFKCWSTISDDDSCSSTYNFNTPVYNDRTLYAQWQKNNDIQYEYVKTTWEASDNWITQIKNGDNVKLIDTKYDREATTQTKSYTYRTTSWFSAGDNAYNYQLYLNNIPYNATNVRITSQSRFASRSEIQQYLNNRYTCVIQMVGSGCPSPYDEGIISNSETYYTSVGRFTSNISNVQRMGSKWGVNVYVRPYGNPNIDQLLAPIKFNVSWTEKTYENITKYRYSYKTTITKYSTSNNDQSLLNDGYVATGRTKTV